MRVKFQFRWVETIGGPPNGRASCAIAAGELSWDYSQASPGASGQARVKATPMSRDYPSANTVVSELSPDLQNWLDSQDLGRLPTLTKDAALKFLNDRGMPVRRNAVVTAFNSKELVSGIYSGKRLASEYEVLKWAISRLGDRHQTAVGT
jgi:hypothetical protein